MLPTFVIGLREGLEAALIVGIVAAFLRQRGRRDAMRWMWLGVLIAVLICVAIGVGLRLAEEQLPQREQEQLETVIGLIAVGMITWMIVWMKRHARNLRGELEAHADQALIEGSTLALVGMAFLAVLREGIETTVFLLAAFQQSTRPGLTGTGAVLGVLARGDPRLRDLPRRRPHQPREVLHGHGRGARAGRGRSAGDGAAHRARGRLVRRAPGPGPRPEVAGEARLGPVRAPDGMLGIQPEPTVGEVVVWLAYAVPMTYYVCRRPRAARTNRSEVGAVQPDPVS